MPLPARPFRLFRATLVPVAALCCLQASAEESAIPVITAVAERTDGVEREFSLTGTVTARREAKLSSRTGGLVAEVKVDAGSLVNPGDVLATLDTKLAEIALDLIRAEITQAEVELAEAQRREEEVREISRTGGFAKSDAEARKTEVRVREAALARLRVQERQQTELIERHRLVAPFRGVVSEKLAEAGEWVETGTPVLELVETEKPRFDLRVPQEFLARLSSAQEVEVVLDAFPDRVLKATIDVMVPVKDEVSRTFLTRLELIDADRLAAPGMSGKARVKYRTNGGGSVAIPRDAAVRFPDGTVKVWIVEDAKVRSQEIRTAGTLGTSMEVLEGLKGGETLVLKGNEGLQEGQAVTAETQGAVEGKP